MKYRYTKFTGNALDDLDLEDLVAKLSDLLLSSGFDNPYGSGDADRTMQALHDAILDALFNGGVLPDETVERLLGDPADADQADLRSKLEIQPLYPDAPKLEGVTDDTSQILRVLAERHAAEARASKATAKFDASKFHPEDTSD